MTPADPLLWPPPIVVHDLDGALAAAAAAQAIDAALHLRTAEGAAAYLGLAWFQALDRAVAARFSLPRRLVLDCADETGLATMALRQGLGIRTSEEGALRERLTAFATANGAFVDCETRPPLDLLDQHFPESLCRHWIEGWLGCESGGAREPAAPLCRP